MINLGDNFYPKLVQISSELGMNPEDLLAVMVSESGINPGAHEAKYNGGGLLGFMPQTLKNLNFKGTPEDFRKLAGEDQLDYVKKLVQGYQKFNNGKPFTSAAQYYVANFWPVALKLPGIQENNPNTVFIEENPQVIKKNGQLWSKKYYDLGIKVNALNEREAYRANPLFHGNVSGKITYGDMINQINKNKNSNVYKQALLSLNKVDTKPSQMIAKTEPKSLDEELNQLLSLVASNKIFNQYLPKHKILISLGYNDLINNLEFSRILCLALNEELGCYTEICSDHKNVEINCEIAGPATECLLAVEQLSQVIKEAFETATKKMLIKIAASYKINKISELKPITFEIADINYRKFLYQFKGK